MIDLTYCLIAWLIDRMTEPELQDEDKVQLKVKFHWEW